MKIETGDESVDRFIKKVESTIRKDRVKLVLSFSDISVESNSVDGYFSPDDKQICVNAGKPYLQWIDILTHEFNHYIQWKTQADVWKNLDIRGSNSYSIFWDWLDGDIELNGVIDLAVERIVTVEHDCERRTIQMIKDESLPIDIQTYTRSANSYLVFLNYVKTVRSWSKCDMIGEESILTKMPSELLEPKALKELSSVFN